MSRIVEEIKSKLIINQRPSNVGKIKIGEKSEKGYPRSLDYFICKSENENYIDMFNEVFGYKPNTLKIKFDNIDAGKVCFEQIVFRNTAGKKVAYGDGATFYEYDLNSRKWNVSLNADGYCNKSFDLRNKYKVEPKIELVLIFKLVELEKFGFFGNWVFETKGMQTSISSITTTFDNMVNIANSQNIDFREFEFDLNVKKHTSNNISNSSYPIVSLVANFYDKIKNNTNNNLLLNNNNNFKLETHNE